ncbi:hypothetical protein [Raoultibacter phocaeensis]|uniref:hypothetical protein n=1 Tax=Raoultibacter phocaeensis TaxID=2479841 RepID=UPI001119CB9E|nr:hypothetical protein [Raoultibacter phocaeensis]
MKLEELPTIDNADPVNGRAKPDPRERGGVAPGTGSPAPKKRRVLVAIAAVLVLLAAAGAIWLLAGGAPDDFFDADAQSGQAPYKTQEEIQAELDRVVEEGMFNISIASLIEFADGTSPGTAYIENVPGNRYLMQVTISLDDTGEAVYESKAIKPGSYIENVALATDLEPSDYPATATFAALDPDSREEIGRAAAKVTLSVRG